MFAFTNGFVTLTLIHIRKHNLTRIIFVWLNYEPISEAIERAASPLTHTLQVDESEASQTFHAGTGINLMHTQSIKERLRTQIEELTEVTSAHTRTDAYAHLLGVVRCAALCAMTDAVSCLSLLPVLPIRSPIPIPIPIRTRSAARMRCSGIVVSTGTSTSSGR